MDKNINSIPLLYRKLLRLMAPEADMLQRVSALRRDIADAAAQGKYRHDRSDIDAVTHHLNVAVLLAEMVSPDPNMIATTLLTPLVSGQYLTLEDINASWGPDVAALVHGRLKVAGLYGTQTTVVQTDNFRRLLLTFAEDIRVIIIMIVDRLALMRAINHHPDEQFVNEIATESSYLYAPLAHRLGLYKIKSELEDMSLKYTNRQLYTQIANGLNQKKKERDAYIAAFIAPIRQRLEPSGLKFEIKGRTKSIYSIWNKLRKQQIELSGIYDLFAIRIIIDVPREREKSECWNVYSVVTDMYTPNPARLKDWVSIPKSNGYESLHITVKGPDNKWVEVQIRTRRMDLVAEKGVAAHWRYKGIESEDTLDSWMNSIRDILETGASGPDELMRRSRMDIYDKEVFVFTPKGDLYKLPLGATVLDFAFNIHSKLGCICTGGRVNGRNRKLSHRLQSGDTVEILTASTQTPKQDWLNMVVTTKARNKIRQAINERTKRTADYGKELLMRRCKNRKVELEEGSLMKLIKQMGYKTVTDFYAAIGDEHLDPADVIERYLELLDRLNTAAERVSAEEYELQTPEEQDAASADVVVIGDNIKGINYRLARCCNPIYGDKVFGFVSAEGVIKIHRDDCPNARHLREQYPYRVIRTRWSGKMGTHFGATLKIIGRDDIGIVTNITSIITKESKASLRSISIDSHDGLFSGFLVVGVADTDTLTLLIRKLKTVKGVKDVQRAN